MVPNYTMDEITELDKLKKENELMTALLVTLDLNTNHLEAVKSLVKSQKIDELRYAFQQQLLYYCGDSETQCVFRAVLATKHADLILEAYLGLKMEPHYFSMLEILEDCTVEVACKLCQYELNECGEFYDLPDTHDSEAHEVYRCAQLFSGPGFGLDSTLFTEVAMNSAMRFAVLSGLVTSSEDLQALCQSTFKNSDLKAKKL